MGEIPKSRIAKLKVSVFLFCFVCFLNTYHQNLLTVRKATNTSHRHQQCLKVPFLPPRILPTLESNPTCFLFHFVVRCNMELLFTFTFCGYERAWASQVYWLRCSLLLWMVLFKSCARSSIGLMVILLLTGQCSVRCWYKDISCPAGGDCPCPPPACTCLPRCFAIFCCSTSAYSRWSFIL